VLLAAETLALPILHVASRNELGQATGAEEGVRFCPACWHPLEPAAEGRCEACGARFQVRNPRTPTRPPGQ
jgi:predicted amidophosphoribosyltransferase